MSDATNILADLKQKRYAPVYFLCGSEPYFIDQVSDYIEDNVLDEGEKGFNQTVIYGKDTTMSEVLENAKRFPMMAEHQVIIVKEAQHLTKQLAQLESYIEQPQTTTILVFAYKYKTPDGRSKITKLLKKHAVYMESKPLYENKVPAFVTGRLKEMGYQIDPNATRMLVEFLGTDLGKINNELSKLAIVHSKDRPITPQVIEDNIGISKDYNNFELRKAMGMRDVVKVHKIINYFADNPKDNPLVLTTAQLYSFFTQLLKVHTIKDKNPQAVAKAAGVNPFFVQEIITAAKNYPMKYCSRSIKLIRDMDVKSKGVGTHQANHHDLLKEVMVNIMSK
ncbi:DNA polymerase III delta subunit [Nonlabens xylanidelens]|uniref:DNA polymerase III subunit delta n=1 Tax=Nonlabens xylanidelens TaxID=191564 RepID=A0A2S6IGI1_9FLAO|nr:DNA polymerase III subunit delta [Nonlabens xylanidelens]PPK93296.1 DNA polymerase III delta subunit [Nonlabens xylanidelens]PQJ20885.1 DNA polymerase III subunit delta [Nonlabens xylanidelens]